MRKKDRLILWLFAVLFCISIILNCIFIANQYKTEIKYEQPTIKTVTYICNTPKQIAVDNYYDEIGRNIPVYVDCNAGDILKVWRYS